MAFTRLYAVLFFIMMMILSGIFWNYVSGNYRVRQMEMTLCFKPVVDFYIQKLNLIKHPMGYFPLRRFLGDIAGCFLIGVICSVSRMTCTTKVSEVDCPNGVTDCSAHSACGSSGKCECSAGYGEDKTDGSTCVKLTVSDVSCTSNGGTECTAIAHSACGSSGKCKCSAGYGEDKTDGSTCVQIVSGVSCTGTAQCPGIDNSVCSSGTCACKNGFSESANTCVKVYGTSCTGSSACPGDLHSLCKNDKCACADNYEEKNGVCTPTLSSKTCSANGNECDTVPNAECDVTSLKCKCSDGYVMNADVCAAENAASTLKCGAATLLLYVIMAVCK